MDNSNNSGVREYRHTMTRLKNHLKQAKARRGDQPVLQPTAELYKRHMAALAMENTVLNQHMILTTFVPPAYPPCITPIASLRPILIRDLRLETHHRGTYLKVRSITPARRLTALQVIVVDECDGAVMLALYQQASEAVRPAKQVVDVGTALLIKEPYLKVMAGGAYGLRVDHPSDILRLDSSNSELPSSWRTPELQRSAQQVRVMGDDCIATRDYWKAIDLYSRALSQPDALGQSNVIKHSRALAYLQTKQYDACLADTGYPDVDAKSSEKALSLASEALYHLGRFRECCSITEALVKAHPENWEARFMLNRAQARVDEQLSGVFDFAKMHYDSRTVRPPQLDFATYIGPVEIKQTANKGRGLFLTADVKAGDLLMCEKAFCHMHVEKVINCITPGMNVLMHTDEDQISIGGQADLAGAVVRKLHMNPSLVPEFTDLYHGEYEGASATVVDSQLILDTFLVAAIVSANDFGCPTTSNLINYRASLEDDDQSTEDSNETSGIWTKASYINHSCFCNAYRAFIGDMMVVRAAKDLKAGTEIRFWYLSPLAMESEELRTKLQHWGFVCDCAICRDTETTDAAMLANRKLIDRVLEALFDSNMNNSILHIIQSGFTLLDATYVRPASEVPRLTSWEFRFALAHTYAQKGDMVKCLEWVEKTLISLGFIAVGANSRNDSSFIIQSWGIVGNDVVLVFLQAKAAFEALGPTMSGKARQAEEYARIAYKIVVGEDASFSETHG